MLSCWLTSRQLLGQGMQHACVRYGVHLHPPTNHSRVHKTVTHRRAAAWTGPGARPRTPSPCRRPQTQTAPAARGASSGSRSTPPAHGISWGLQAGGRGGRRKARQVSSPNLRCTANRDLSHETKLHCTCNGLAPKRHVNLVKPGDQDLSPRAQNHSKHLPCSPAAPWRPGPRRSW